LFCLPLPRYPTGLWTRCSLGVPCLSFFHISFPHKTGHEYRDTHFFMLRPTLHSVLEPTSQPPASVWVQRIFLHRTTQGRESSFSFILEESPANPCNRCFIPGGFPDTLRCIQLGGRTSSRGWAPGLLSIFWRERAPCHLLPGNFLPGSRPPGCEALGHTLQGGGGSREVDALFTCHSVLSAGLHC
jgi:hypothetical protein